MCQDCGTDGPSESVSRRAFLSAVPRLYAAPVAGALVAGVAEKVLRYPAGWDPLLASSAPKRVDIICKKAWGAKPPSGKFRAHTIKRITVHHSAVALTDNRDAPRHFRSYQADHQALGWPDIAYHVLIDRHGNVYKGRPSRFKGDTRTNYDPTGHFLVMCDGNFSEQDISRAQLTSLVDVLAAACTKFSVSRWTIKGHRDYAATSCPGRLLYKRLQSGRVRRRVHDRLQAGGVELHRLCGEAGVRRVRRIENGND